MSTLFKKEKKGFTLIELLVVIAIIGLLSSVVLVSLGGAREKARDARRNSDIRQISLAMEMCSDDTACSGGTRAGQYKAITVDASSRLTVTAITTYLPVIPADPGGGAITTCSGTIDEMTAGNYCAFASSAGATEYCIYAKLSNGKVMAASEKGVSEMSALPASATACP
jgi:prepilin-type N-terminal cleavage/methylation domain-containing protein